MTIHTSQVKVNGLPAGTPVKVNTSQSNNAGYWIKVARANTATNYDTSQSVFLFSFPGYDYSTNNRHRNEFIATVRYTAYSSSPYYHANGTIIEVSSINSNELDGWDPTADIALLVNNEDASGGAELWVKISEPYLNVIVTPLSATVDTVYNDPGFEVIDGTKTTNNFQAALPAAHIQNIAGADRDYVEINGTWSDKIVGTLTLADNVLKDSGGNTILSSNGSGAATLAGTATTLATARNISLGGDVTGTVSFDGSANVTMTTTVGNNSHTHTSANISDATSANTGNMIVKRDASGNFSAGTITATLSGNATTADRIDTTATSTSANYYLTFVDSSSSTSGETLRVDSGLIYNPSTNFLTIAGDLRVSGQNLYGPADNYLMIHSDTDMYFDIDDDGDSTSKFYFRSGNTSRMELDESGNLQIDGDLTLTGNDIIGTSLKLDSSGDITLSADGDQIRMDDGTSNRFTFNLDNTPQLDVVGNFILDGSGTIEIDSASSILLDAAGDITLSADGDQIRMDDGTNTRFTFNLDNTPELDVTGNFILDGSGTIEIDSASTMLLDAAGDITLDADGGQVYFKDNGTTYLQFNVDGSTDSIQATGHLTLDASGDITLDADGGDIHFKDGGASLGSITSAGYSGNAATATTLATARTIGGISFNGSANITPQNIDITTDSGNATHYVPFFDGTTGVRRPKTDSDLTYNPSSNRLTAGRVDTNFISADSNFMIDSDSTGNRHLNFKLTEGSTGIQVMSATGESNGTWIALMEVDPQYRTSYWSSANTFGAVMQYDASANYLKFTGRNGTSGTNMVYWERDTGNMNIYGKFLFRVAPPDQNAAGGGSGSRWDLQMKASSGTSAPFTIVYINSTKKVKKDIVSIDRADSLEKLKKLRPVTYTHKSDKQEDMGFIAEEVYEIDPILSCMDADYKYDENGEKIVKEKTEEGPVYELESDNSVPGGYSTRNMTTLTVSALQALIDRVEQLELEVKKLKGSS